MATASPNGDQAANPGRPRLPESPPEFVSIPADVLLRHRARVLDPSSAVPDPDGVRPESTAYRADTLLIPWSEEQSLLPPDPEKPDEYTKALEPLGVWMRRDESPGWREGLRKLNPRLDLPVPVRLVPRAGATLQRAPDAWVALQALRNKTTGDARERVEQFSLDHLMVAASVGIQAAPVHGGPVHGGPVHGGPVHGGSGGIALYTGSRNPVRVMLANPPRPRPPAELRLERRPVVAVLDTGIEYHHWLWPIGDRSGKPAEHDNPNLLVTTGVFDDTAVEVSADFQSLLAAHELASGSGVAPFVLDDPWDKRDLIQPLLGLTDSHSGHGTFAAGVIRQTCPDARILSLRILHTDGISTKGSFLLALEWLRDRVAQAQVHGRSDELVDVVSLSLGFYPETSDPEKVPAVKKAIEELTKLGVVVVAAGGNDATTRPFMPAALGANAAGTQGNPMVAAIGALNASGVTTAAFSNHGDWINRWAPGNALVSTVPLWQGSAAGGLALPDAGVGPRWRTAPDEDDLTTGFAVWAGTSFATPVIAGMVADALANDETISLGKAGQQGSLALEVTDQLLIKRGWRYPPPG